MSIFGNIMNKIFHHGAAKAQAPGTPQPAPQSSAKDQGGGVATAPAPVVGVSPVIGGAPVRGMADKVLAAIGVETSASAVALHYGADLLDGWLVDTADGAAVETVTAAGIRCRAVPLRMTDVPATAAMAAAALELVQ